MEPGGIDVASTGSSTTTYFYFAISGLTVSPNCMASASTIPDFTNAPGYTQYRMVGALYTDSSANVVRFVQSGDKFTLRTSVQFAGFIPSVSTPVHLTSVPAIVSVEAFGRCAASVAMTLSTGNVPAQVPSSTFSTTPGYMVKSPTPDSAFPFQLYTTGASGPAPGGTINAASTAFTPEALTCYNDGWVFHP